MSETGQRAGKKRLSWILAAILLLLGLLSVRTGRGGTYAAEPGDTLIAYGSGFHHYCIDGYGSARALISGDEYEYILPSQTLTDEERAVVFWAMFSLQASFGTDQNVNTAYAQINSLAESEGLSRISPCVTESDLKKIIHASSVRNKYSWLDTVLANEEAYLRMAGLLSGNQNTVGGGSVPDVLAGHTSSSSALSIASEPYEISFDASGADAGFIASVQLLYSSDGSTYSTSPPSAWLVQKSETAIAFTYTGTDSSTLYLKFDPAGTAYQSSDGFSSVEEVYESCLQVWVCTKCAGTHTQSYKGTAPTGEHQRLVFVEIEDLPAAAYYAKLGTGGTAAASRGNLNFQVYRHEEDFSASYNLQMYKYDYETGEPLEDAVFNLYERFDDQDEIDTDSDGPAALYEGGDGYQSYHTDNPVYWDGFRLVTALVTDEDGCASKTVTHGYHYDKTFCDGHPAPTFVEVPEYEEEEEDDGEGGGGEDNSEEIEAAQEENRRLAALWIACEEACGAKASGSYLGVHFHWIMDEVDAGEILSIASSGGEEGETPSGGRTDPADADTAFEESGCADDAQETYDRLISLRYSYALEEDTARSGYALHGLHTDDLPIEVITTDASENGANACFADLYGDEIEAESVTYTSSAAAAALLAAQEEEETVQTAVYTVSSVSAAAEISEASAVSEAAAAADTEEEEADSPAAASPWSIRSLWQRLVRLILPWVDWGDEEDEPAADTALINDLKGEKETGQPAAVWDLSGGAGTASFSGGDKATSSNAVQSPPAAAGTAVLSDAGTATPSNAGTAAPSNTAVLDTTEASGAEIAAISVASASETSDTAAAAVASETSDTAAAAVSVSSVSAGSVSVSSGASAAAVSDEEDDSADDLFSSAYSEALESESSGDGVSEGPHSVYSHCNNADGEGDAWRIYNHRTEGEIHINKRDLDLLADEEASDGIYDSCGDTQGDASLQGAVYGLFAAADLIHPDGKTGTVYEANDLVAVAAADQEGNASFFVCTEAPGMTYDYSQGAVVGTKDGWADRAPGNLYTADTTIDDYTADGSYVRSYADNAGRNANAWIGRPLLLGDYYIKELTRSEGYELSVGGRMNAQSNIGQDLTAAVPEETDGYAAVTQQLYYEEQIADDAAGACGDPDYNELFFEVESLQTGGNGFDLVFTNLPSGTALYRLDLTTEERTVTAGTGTYEQVYETDEYGNYVYVTAESDYQYLRYNEDGSIMTQETEISCTVTDVPVVTWEALDEELLAELLPAAEDDLTEEEVYLLLGSDFSEDAADFVQTKLSAVLKASGRSVVSESGRGSEEKPAWPILELSFDKEDADGAAITVGDALATILNFYSENGFYTCTGLSYIEAAEDVWLVGVYAGRSGSGGDFYADDGSGGVFYRRLTYCTADSVWRYVYAAYSEDGDGTFGTYTDLEITESAGESCAAAVLMPDALADETGALYAKTATENVYYLTGETPCDAQGNPIKKVTYVEITVEVTVEAESGVWAFVCTLDPDGDGESIAHQDGIYEDSFGAEISDEDETQTYLYKLVLPTRFVTLTADDMVVLADSGWEEDDEMGAAAYWLTVQFAYVRAYLDADSRISGSADSYVKSATLTWPGQSYAWQDGSGQPGAGTSAVPVTVEERVIRQKIKVAKQIDLDSFEETVSYADLHLDWWTVLFGGYYGESAKESVVEDFRFKAYLKSNLERLYRDADGAVVWVDADGNEMEADGDGVPSALGSYPEIAQKIYTLGVCGSGGGSGEYARLLETKTMLVEDGDSVRTVTGYNYDKFFSALAVANGDRWDGPGPAYTSWAPIGNAQNRSEETLLNAQVSDRVRQFAVDWYLDAEVEALTAEADMTAVWEDAVPAASDGTGADADVTGAQDETSQDSVRLWSETAAYADELYDLALARALEKAQDYLTPFFASDLDEIYALSWDGEEDGGEDGDLTTVTASSAWTGDDGYCFGVSAYLPYGIYVVVEQQPDEETAGDFKNRHYAVDSPKEVSLPSVYADYASSQEAEASFNSYYFWDPDLTAAEEELRYRIRFREETREIAAHSRLGDFTVYPFGLEPESAASAFVFSAGAADYAAALSVSEDAGTADDVAYPGGTATGTNPGGVTFRDGVRTMQGVRTACEDKYAPMLVPYTVTEPQSAGSEVYETEPESTGESSYIGYGYGKFRNRLYAAMLRVEKIDAGTHEPLLHDGAAFAIYAAERDDSADGTGRVLFYEEDTQVTGTLPFLLAMGAGEISPADADCRAWNFLSLNQAGQTVLFTGTVPAGTPVCSEEEKVTLTKGTAVYEDTPTVVSWEDADGHTFLQTAGYLMTAQPLSAGVYVLCETKVPAGYVRTKPIAIEIYSDRVTYYKEGARDSRVAAAVYTCAADSLTAYENKPEDAVPAARIFAENVPIRLQAEKVKETADGTDTVTYRVSGRVDGSLSQLDGSADYIYACKNGEYLGYAYKKGTLEYLMKRKETAQAGAADTGTAVSGDETGAGSTPAEEVEIVYEGGVFAGYGYITRRLASADDENSYAAGARMTLFDAVELEATGGTEDYAFAGLVIERDDRNHVTAMYVQENYAGARTEFFREETETGTVSYAAVVARGDTDILYYDLSGLAVTETDTVDGTEVTCGYTWDYEKIPLPQAESDRLNYRKTDREHALYAFKGGLPYLEITGGDFTQISYSATDKVLTVAAGTHVYHLDRDGNRDALVDPYTGMAYTVENFDGTNGSWDQITGSGAAGVSPDGAQTVGSRVFVWPVNLRRDEDGNLVSRDKITTSRIAMAGENLDGYSEEEVLDVVNLSENEIADDEKPSYAHTESGYITGTWEGEDGGESHRLESLPTNSQGQNLNGEALTDACGGSFVKTMEPAFDEHGLVTAWRQSDAAYDKGTDIYDRSGTFVRSQDADSLEAFNAASAFLLEREDLFDGDTAAADPQRVLLVHRLGEVYVLENTWYSSEKTPNDPFSFAMTDGQPDILKRVAAGCYIMEELTAPAGYAKGFPTAVKVVETAEVQTAAMANQSIKVEIAKLDAPASSSHTVVDRLNGDAVLGTEEEDQSLFGYGSVNGAVLALYEAERVYDVGEEKGYRLEKTADAPFVFASTDSRQSGECLIEAVFTVGDAPVYLEGLPAGSYLLEELSVPEGFVTAEPVGIEVAAVPQVQVFTMYDDHTRVEIEKLARAGSAQAALAGAQFALYPAMTDAAGNPVCEDGEASCEETDLLCSFTSAAEDAYDGFITAFEELYNASGAQEGLSLVWTQEGEERTAVLTSAVRIDASAAGGTASVHPTAAVMTFETDDGETIRAAAYESYALAGGADVIFEYQFDFRELPEAGERAVTYVTARGLRRFEYLPAGAAYVLVETAAPAGYMPAASTLIEVLDTADVQRYSIENTESALIISKAAEGLTKELPGAVLGLYRCGKDGEFVESEEYLLTTWESASDGAYSELDYVNRRILAGYETEDNRPHILRRMPAGTYWLAELSAPDYYEPAAPVLISFSQEDQQQFVRLLNRPREGVLTVRKTDAAGEAVSGAVFVLAAYSQDEADTPVFIKTLRVLTETGEISAAGLPVGESDDCGVITPYRYTLAEIVPPAGYACCGEIFEWEFPADGEAEVEITVSDERTRLWIGKQSFGTDQEGLFVEGAVLAVCEVAGLDSAGEAVYDADAPFDTWVSAAEDHLVEGLVAGQTYILIELFVPDGYYPMEPLLFALTADGNSLAFLSTQLAVISAEYTQTESAAAGLEEAGAESDGETADQDETAEETAQAADLQKEISALVIRARYLSDGSGLDGVTLSLERDDGLVIWENDNLTAAFEYRVENEEADDGLIFRSGPAYFLREFVEAGEGQILERSRLCFSFDETDLFCRISGCDRETDVSLSKAELTGGEELPGCEMSLWDEDGSLIDEWVSAEEPHRLIAVLIPGKTYILREERPADGYAFADEISFTVNETGVSQAVVMADEQTQAEIIKLSAETGSALKGAEFILYRVEAGENGGEENLEEVCSWTSDGEPYLLTGILWAGGTYLLRETKAPAGYLQMEDLYFEMPEEAEPVTIVCENERKPAAETDSGSGTAAEAETAMESAVKQIGEIGVSYEPAPFKAAGWLYIGADGRVHLRLPKTGEEEAPPWGLYALLSLAAAGICWGFYRRKK